MEALCERVLVLVPAEELETTANLVLHEEFLALDEAVNDVLAAFAKLEEVRTAVSKLEQDCASSTGRSSSLLTNTIVMQRQLEKGLRKIAVSAPVDTTADDKKRKRNHKDLKKSSAGDTESVANTQIEGSKSQSKSRGGVHQLTQVKTKNTTQMTPAPQSKTSSHTRNEVDATTRRRKLEAKPPRYYIDRVKEVDALPPKERIHYIPHLLRELTVFLDKDRSYGQRFQITGVLHDILRWIIQMSGQEKHLEMLLDFTERMKSFVNKLPNSAQTRGLLRLTDKLSGAMHGKRISFGKTRYR
ncbi:hypothetical protein L915_05172 [Phytophthora nicotianae]|uniref:Uncharacterized protein n=2 Tax=Phytophthora nicotianae TaxID=4792 RepID=V9FIM8_PHYNI|nr:hypothetical protein F443_05318 [Phytophthora nicotianae P1569]ETK91195.1 hypothetical protein L915_05172 [Phytophthora nicotianae]